jgi:hypothetical protein
LIYNKMLDIAIGKYGPEFVELMRKALE